MAVVFSHDEWNYLRMRGEEMRPQKIPIHHVELPPHARRRAVVKPATAKAQGITSACAEKSVAEAKLAELTRNYLRMRGEEVMLFSPIDRLSELPPHARRRGRAMRAKTIPQGITSACAEKRCVYVV